MQKAFLTVLTVLTLTCCLATTGASAQAGKINEKDLVGTWTLVSIQNTLPDGKKAEGFGAGDGMAVFDSNGKFVQALSRHDIPKVASNNRNTATPEEGKAIVQNSLILYGTYSFDSAGMLILHVDRSTFPNWNGTDQKRKITSLTANELKWHNPAASIGGTTETTWKR
jgi:hypothetical protein